MMRIPALCSILALSLLPACADDGGSGDAAGSSSDDGASSSGDDAVDSTGMMGSTSDEPGTTTGVDTDDESTGEEGSTGEPVDGPWGALVLGTLFTDDMAMAQATHDAVAMGGQADAMAAGDFGHDALLGTTLLGTTENQFLGIDQWEGLEGAQLVYGDPDFQAAFGMLFARPPSVELFELREDWHGWGSLEAGDGGDHWFVVVRGRLAEGDLGAAQAMHDELAAGGQDAAMMLGDVAHVVWVGTPEDPQQFFAVDVWTSDEAIEAFYGDPTFQAAFGALFEAPPTVGVYASTDWHQW